MAKTPFDACLAPLTRLARRHPDAEGQVIWWTASGWEAQEDDEAMMDAEECPYYAEGLLAEGFGLHWQALAEVEAPDRPVLLRLFFWEPGSIAVPPAADDGWTVAAEARHEAAAA